MKVALTRSPEDVQKDKVALEREGFQVVELPLLEEVPLPFEVPKIEFDYVVFLSPRAVRLFLSKCQLGEEKIVVVGEKTAREVRAFGYQVWAMPEEYYGQELLELFRGLKGRVLLPRSAVGREEVLEGLKSLGLEVYPLEVYTVRAKLYEEEEIKEKLSQAQVVVFASPSAVKGLLANLRRQTAQSLLAQKRLLCLGKTTESVLRQLLDLPCLKPEKPTLESLIALLKTLA